MMTKFADYPVVMLDIYGRERHLEATSTQLIQENYNERRQRAELMMFTFQYIPGGIPPTNRVILIDEDYPEEARAALEATNPQHIMTQVTHAYGGRPQGSFVIDLKGNIVNTQQWERPELVDEVLSNIFGVAAGL